MKQINPSRPAISARFFALDIFLSTCYNRGNNINGEKEKMRPDFENFRRRDLYETNPSLARQKRAEKYGWIPMLVFIVLILAAIFGW